MSSCRARSRRRRAAAARRDEILSPITSIASGGGPIHATPDAGDRAGEVGVLGEEPVAGVHAVGAALADRVEDRLGVEVALGRGLAAERVRLVGVAHVRGVAVELGVDGDGRDAELATRSHDADRDLAAVGDQDLREHGCVSYGCARGGSEVAPLAEPEGAMVTPASPPSGAIRAWRALAFATCAGSTSSIRPIGTCSNAPRAGAPEGVVAVADEQTAGRGRLGSLVDRAAGLGAPRLGAPAPAAARRSDAPRHARGRARRARRHRRARFRAPRVSSGRTTSWSTTASSPASSPRPTARARSSSAWAATCARRVPRRAPRDRDRGRGRPASSSSSRGCAPTTRGSSALDRVVADAIGAIGDARPARARRAGPRDVRGHGRLADRRGLPRGRRPRRDRRRRRAPAPDGPPSPGYDT